MKKLLLVFIVISFSILAESQNVGINNPAPTEKLDVNGNVNITGTIKTSGISGRKGQVLMSTGTGLSWGSTAGYRKSQSYASPGANQFTVPAGVTEVMVEVWGAGSGGTLYCGGTSGGYARTVRAVTPGDVVFINIGAGSPFGNSITTSGGTTSAVFGADQLNAYGGSGITSANLRGLPVSGATSGSFDNVYFFFGNAGTATTYSGYMKNSTTYVEVYNYGGGGAATGFLNIMPEPGDHVRFENGTVINVLYSFHAKIPSGGGPAGYAAGGWNGANGFGVVWWN